MTPIPGSRHRGFGPGEQVLSGEAENHGPFGEIVCGGGKAGDGDGRVWPSVSQQAGHGPTGPPPPDRV
jgi:hypothetical protein